MGARRGSRRLVLTMLFVAAPHCGPALAQRISYPPVPPGDMVTLHGRPRIPYVKLPLDARIAPDDFAYDTDEEEPASPEQARRAADRIALAQLSQNYRPSPAIWRIGDRDTTIYLFGTIHVLPPGFNWRSAAIDRVVAQAQSLIVESVDDEAGSPAPGRRAGAAGLPPLAARVSPDHRPALTRFVDALPPGAATELDGMPTWVAAIAVGFVREVQTGEIPGPGADDWLEATFRRAGKPVVAIENGAQVMASVSAMPAADQRRMLDAALDAATPSRAELRAPTHAWAKGQVGRDSALRIDLDTTGGENALSGPLLADRNRAWARALADRLKTPGIMLFAAGAGHFIGPGSVLDLLKKHGIHVRRVA